MNDSPAHGSLPSGPPPAPKPRRRRRWIRIAALVVLLYLGIAYWLMPQLWERYVRRHPAFADVPRVTHTHSGIPGDPLNVALIGTELEVKTVMIAAKWYPADPLTLKSCLEIAEASVLKRPYDDAPVSNLFLLGRREDLAFEQPVGKDPRKRHHVRLWKTELLDHGIPIWVGAAIFDERVGISRTTGQVTHVTAPDIDAERDTLFRDLEATGRLTQVDVLDDFHQVRSGKNGGGDPWHTDGKLKVGILAENK